MSIPKQHSLDAVVKSIDQLFSTTIEWMLTQTTYTSDQLVLTPEWIKALRHLQKMVHKDLKSAQGNRERVWQIVTVIIATVTRYILEKMSSPSKYQLRREYDKPFLMVSTHG